MMKMLLSVEKRETLDSAAHFVFSVIGFWEKEYEPLFGFGLLYGVSTIISLCIADYLGQGFEFYWIYLCLHVFLRTCQ